MPSLRSVFLPAFVLPVLLLAADSPIAPVEEALLRSVTANALKGHISFLASDLLEGRDTPSRGLDIAAEYIATRFQSVGLEPAGTDGYFQDAPFVSVRQPMDGFEMTVETGGKTLTLPKEKATAYAPAAIDLSRLAIVKMTVDEIETATAAQVAGKAVYLAIPSLYSLRDAERQGFARKVQRARQRFNELKPAVLLTPSTGMRGSRPQLRDSSDPASVRVASISIGDSDLNKALQGLESGAEAFVSAKVPAAIEEPVKLRNVAGVLRGSDPLLKDTYILVTAHYDHIGVRTSGDGDRINNGANDDASGTACVLELAAAFARLPERPKRSILFMTYFGEELGLLGSRYYGRNPLVPLAKTVANLNLEHMGRTDDSEGSTTGKLTASGFDYTSLGETLTQAGRITGIETWHHERNSDGFFARSDNQSLADAGVPAITLAVAWIFGDYHRPGDHWDKIDYPNMEKVNRTVALALWRIAANPEPPHWIESNPKTAAYRKAYQALHAAQ